MGPQQPTPPRRVPMGRAPEELTAPEPGVPTPPRTPVAPVMEQAPQEGERRTSAYRLNTVGGSGNTTNNPDNNITARTLEEGAGLEQ